nr:immunoglobulin light chain junction region [Macaca mulatta]
DYYCSSYVASNTFIF